MCRRREKLSHLLDRIKEMRVNQRENVCKAIAAFSLIKFESIFKFDANDSDN